MKNELTKAQAVILAFIMGVKYARTGSVSVEEIAYALKWDIESVSDTVEQLRERGLLTVEILPHGPSEN